MGNQNLPMTTNPIQLLKPSPLCAGDFATLNKGIELYNTMSGLNYNQYNTYGTRD